MNTSRKAMKKACTTVMISILLLTGLALGQDEGLQKEIEAIYATRQKAILKKDFARLKSDQADDYTEKSKDGTVQNRKQADVEADQLYSMVKEIFSYSIQVVAIQNKNNEIIVDTADSGEFSFVGPDDKIHRLTGKGRQRDIWIRTQQGLKMKYHEELESNVQMDGKPIQ